MSCVLHSAFRMAAEQPSPAMQKLERLLQDDSEKAGLGLVACVDKVLEELQATGMAWKQRIRPCQVGVDPSNRDGVGVNVEDVHALGSDILYLGWSWSQVASAVCVEEAPGSHAIANFNKDLAAGCDFLPGTGLDPATSRRRCARSWTCRSRVSCWTSRSARRRS